MNPIFSQLRKAMRHPMILGTAILTLTGLISRLIGFFYRIYLSRLFGEENMGIYQLISPVISLAFSLCAAGYQTAISKLAAEYAAKSMTQGEPLTKSQSVHASQKPLWVGISLSLPLSLCCTAVTYVLAEPIGILLLKESRTIPLLRMIAFSFPFVGIHACINGWFYGMKKAGLPSIAQLVEQLTRVVCVYLITAHTLSMGETPPITIAVFGLALGELVSMTFALITFLPYSRSLSAKLKSHVFHKARGRRKRSASRPALYMDLLSTAVPLTANRLVLTFLGSAESVAIPEMLRKHGYNTETALSVYGVLTGMALPLIFFPNALTGSMAVMLLPMISESYCLKQHQKLRSLTVKALKYSLLIGGSCLFVFVLFGRQIGLLLFDSPLAGQCIQTLGFICPFLYLDTTLSSILQGLGKANAIFFINILSLLIRLSFVYLTIPLYGIKGYLWGMLAGQLLLSSLFMICLAKFFRPNDRS